jgi:enoyl-CoA hydratase/carnithine racemase
MNSVEKNTDKACVTLSIDKGIAFVCLNRADKHNALNMAMFKSLDKISRQLRSDRNIRAVVVQANGEDFCSGLDVKSVMSSKSSVFTLLKKWWPGRSNLAQTVSTNWRKIPVPVLMVIQGRCWGGGLQIALGGDFRFASPDASFSIMETKWGLIPDMGGNLALRELIGKGQALQLAMTAEVFSASSALEYGLLPSLSAEPLQAALALVEKISRRSPDAVAAIKKLYHRNWHKSDGWMLARESYYQLRIILGKNQQRAVHKQLKPDKAKGYLPRKKW